MRQTLTNLALNEHTNLPSEDHSLLNPSADKSDAAWIQRPNISIPLKQQRDKSSIYRKLFASPSTEDLPNDDTTTEPNDWNPSYLCTATSSRFDVSVPRNLSEVDYLLAKEEYEAKPVSVNMPGSRELGRLQGNSPLYGLPKEGQSERSSKRFRIAKGVTFSPSVFSNSRNALLHDRGLQKGEKHVSLVAAASSSLNSKLRTKVFETDSAFKKIKPPNAAKMLKHSSISVTNSCTPVNERKVVVPIPKRLVVAAHDGVPQGAVSFQFISRHRQIMREALVKSKDHAQEILLDAEVSLYARNIDLLWKSDYSHDPRLVNPLAKLFNEGDERVSVQIHCY